MVSVEWIDTVSGLEAHLKVSRVQAYLNHFSGLRVIRPSGFRICEVKSCRCENQSLKHVCPEGHTRSVRAMFRY